MNSDFVSGPVDTGWMFKHVHHSMNFVETGLQTFGLNNIKRRPTDKFEQLPWRVQSQFVPPRVFECQILHIEINYSKIMINQSPLVAQRINFPFFFKKNEVAFVHFLAPPIIWSDVNLCVSFRWATGKNYSAFWRLYDVPDVRAFHQNMERGGEEPKEKVRKGTIYADQTIGIFNERSGHYLVWFWFLNLHNLCITVVLSRASRSGSNKSQPQGVCFLLKCLRPNGDGEIKWCLPPFGRNKKKRTPTFWRGRGNDSEKSE